MWATGRKVWQGTVTPSRRRTPGSIPGSPTIYLQNLTELTLYRPAFNQLRPKNNNKW